MTLAPLLAAGPVIIAHAALAGAALLVGTVQVLAPKGTTPHRVLGYLWVVLMVGVAAGSFAIHTIRMFGPFSLIHVLSIITLASLPLAVLHARRHRVAAHRHAMLALYVGALLIAGVFTLYPGRIMARVVFGP